MSDPTLSPSEMMAWQETERTNSARALSQAFLDPETWGGNWTSEHQALVDQTIDPEATKKAIANRDWIATQEGKNPEDIAPFLPAYRKAYAQKFFGKPDMGDSELYGAIQTKYQGEEARANVEKTYAGTAIRTMFDEIDTGRQVNAAEMTQGFIKENPDMTKGFSPEEARAYEAALVTSAPKFRELYRELGPVASRVYKAITNQTGLAPNKNAPSMGSAASDLALMPPDKRQGVYDMVTLAWASNGHDPKSEWMKQADAIGRGTLGMANMTVRGAYEDRLNSRKEFLLSGGVGVTAGMSQPYGQELTPEQQKAEIASIDDKLAIVQVLREMEGLAKKVDPTKSAYEGIKGWALNSVSGLSESSGYMLGSMVPGIGPALVFSAVYEGEKDDLLLRNPNLPYNKTASHALAYAIPATAMELFQWNLFKGKAPVLAGALKAMTVAEKGWKGAAKQAGGDLLLRTGQETAVELSQGFLKIAMNAVNQDFPDYNVEKELKAFAEAIPETVGTMFLMSLVGTGIATYHDIKGGERLLKDTKILRAAGINAEDAIAVISQATPEARDAKLKEVWDKRTPESIAEGQKIQKDMADESKAMGASPDMPTWKSVAQEDGTILHTVTGKNGMVFNTTSQEAAQSAHSEEVKNFLTGQRSGISEMISHIDSVNAAVGRGEDVQKIMKSDSAQNFYKEYESDPTQENLDRLFETVRFHGGEISEPEQLKNYWVAASNRGFIKEGIYRSVVRWHEGAATGWEIGRDVAQDNLKRAIGEGDITIEWVRGELEKMKVAKEYSGIRTETDTDVIETFSDVAMDYITGRSKEDQVSPGLRGFLRQFAVLFRDIARRVIRLKQIVADGNVSGSFQKLLATSVGLDPEQIVAFEEQKAQRRMEQETLDALNAGDGAYGDEMLAVFKRGKLPDEKSKFWSAELADLKDTIRETNKGKEKRDQVKLSDVFSNDAGDPDLLIPVFNGQGHPFFTVDDMLESLKARVISGRPEPGYMNNEELQGGHYSIGKYVADVTSADKLNEDGIPESISQQTGTPVGESGKGPQEQSAWSPAPDKSAQTYGGPYGIPAEQAFEKVGYAPARDWGVYRLSQFFSTIGGQRDRHISFVGSGDLPIYRSDYKANAVDFALANEVAVKEFQKTLKEIDAAYSDRPGTPYWMIPRTPQARALFTDAAGKVQLIDHPTGEVSLQPGESNYSIVRAGKSRVNAALESQLKRNPSARIAMYERAKALFNEVRDRRGTSEDPNKKFSSLHQSMGELDAILRVLPAEIRGKVGGWMPLANMGKDTKTGNREATVDKFLAKRIEMVGKALETSLRKEYGAAMERLLEKAKPAKDEAGKKRVGKAGKNIHALFDSIRAAMEFTPEQAAAAIGALESEIASGELSAIDEAHKSQEAGMIALVSDWQNADAERMATAVDTAQNIFTKGYLDFQFKKIAERERRDGIKRSLIDGTGKTGSAAERDAKTLADNGFLPGWKKITLGLLNFEQVVKWAFGDTHPDAERLADMERKAAARKSDRTQQKLDAISDLFAKIAGGRYKGEQLRYDMAQKTVNAGGQTDGEGQKIGHRQLSQLEAISAILMWRQEDGRRHMEGKQDENGRWISAWHYDQAFIDEIETQLSPEARTVMAHIADSYAQEWAELNPIYSELYGVNLPRHADYSPLTVVPLQASAGMSVDPVTGTTSSNGSPTPGSLRTRGTSTAEPDFRDSLQTYIAHTRQMEHWMAYAPFVSEARALLGNRDVGNSVEASSGKEAVNVLRKWLDYFQQGGTRDAAAGLELSTKISRWTNRAASVALVGRLGVLGIQSTQLAAAVAEMPLGSYVVRLGKLLSGQLDWTDAFRSDYIQRRIAQQPPIVKQAVQGLRAEKPNVLKHKVSKLGDLISGADGLFTAGTYAIVLDYQRAQATEMGLVGAEAERFAHNAAERATDRVAQPTRPGARSIFENTSTNPFSRLLWAFASENRKNLGLAAYATAMAKENPARAGRAIFYAVILNAVLTEMIRSAWRDARDSGDEEFFDVKSWNWKRASMVVLTGWLQGIPIIGDVAQDTAFKAVGEYRPNGTLLDSVPKAVGSLYKIDDILAGDEDTEQVLKDVEALLTGLGTMNSTIGAAASLSHLARDIYGIGKNVTKSANPSE